MSANIISELTIIFREIMENESIELTEDTDASHIEEWDSLNHIYLVVEMEKHFNIKFKTEEITLWENVGDIVKSISLNR